jgi:hypothetical protein
MRNAEPDSQMPDAGGLIPDAGGLMPALPVVVEPKPGRRGKGARCDAAA